MAKAKRGQAGPRGEPVGDPLRPGGLGLREEGCPQRSDQARYRHEGEDADDHNRDKRPEVPAAEPNQRAEAAVPGHRHTIAEDQSADDRGGGAPGDRVLVGCRRRGEAEGLGQECADDGNPEDDPPESPASLVGAVDGRFERAQRAEVPQPCGKAEGRSANQSCQRGEHARWYRLHDLSPRGSGPPSRASALATEEFVQQSDHPCGLRIAQGIVDRLSVASCLHKTFEPEPSELLADGRLT